MKKQGATKVRFGAGLLIAGLTFGAVACGDSADDIEEEIDEEFDELEEEIEEDLGD